MNAEPGYYTVQNVDGELLGASVGGAPAWNRLAGDECMWRLDGATLISAVGNRRLSIAQSAHGAGWSLRVEGDGGGADAGWDALPDGGASSYTISPGPRGLPSEHLEDLRDNGFTVLERVMDAEAIARLKREAARVRAENHADEAAEDGQFWMMDGLAWSPDLASAVTHPVALWILERYMGTGDIHYCHQPIITTLKPAKALLGTHPERGWHSDYPYHPGVFPDEYWPSDPVFGVQFNVCIDAFRSDNAATQFVPGSHKLCRRPTDAFNLGGTYMGQGVHQDVRQMQAPAGAALIYDARTWHRACHELNLSGEDRMAILNAVAPAWVPPMIAKSEVTEAYRQSRVPGILNSREKADVERLCNNPLAERPAGAPALRFKRRSP